MPVSKAQREQHIHPKVSANTHEYRPPQPGQSRSPCPALNTMANHGYIARDGRNLTPLDLIKGLKKCYGLSTPLAMFLSFTGFIMLKRIHPISLFEIGKHGAIEHNASLVHHDTPPGEKYAPIEIDPELIDRFVWDAIVEGGPPGESRALMNANDVGRARIRREMESPALNLIHAEIARGEMAIILGLWETRKDDCVGVPVEWLKNWFLHEKLPEGWRPDHTQSMYDVIKRSKVIKTAMNSMRRTKSS